VKIQFEQPADEAAPPPERHAGPRFEHRTEVLTTLVGRDKLRLGDLDAKLRNYGEQGWELVNLSLDAALRGKRDGHLLIFNRAIL
jgi:hypothetical protein